MHSAANKRDVYTHTHAHMFINIKYERSQHTQGTTLVKEHQCNNASAAAADFCYQTRIRAYTQ